MENTKKRFSKFLSVTLACIMIAVVAAMPVSAAQLSESQTSYGFFKAVGASKALQVLNQSFFKSYMHKGDPNDATSLDNMLKALDVIENTNRYRAKEGKNALKVTDTMMAIGQTEANYASPTFDHSRQYNNSNWNNVVSNLAVGTANAFSPESAVASWYGEKPQNTPSKSWVMSHWDDVGHYYTMMSKYYSEGYTVTGAGYNSLTQRKLKGYTAACTVETFGPSAFNGEKTYTVSQYRNRLLNYINGKTSSNTRNTNTTTNNTASHNNNSTIQTSNGSTTKSSDGTYTCNATTIVTRQSSTGDPESFTSNSYPEKNGEVNVYITHLYYNLELGSLSADAVVVNGTNRDINVTSIPKCNVYFNGTLVATDPIWFVKPGRISAHRADKNSSILFKKYAKDVNLSSGTLKVESTVNYTLT